MKNIRSVLFWVVCLIFWNGTYAFGAQVIHNIPPGGVVLNHPGTYVFGNDITWKPNSAVAAITITANNVTLDMKDHTLKSITTSFKTIGILAQTSSNLHIINGTIRGMGIAGIQCNQCANVSIKKITIDGLNVSDTVNLTTATGIFANTCTNVTVEKCTVKNMNVKTASAAGIQFTSTSPSQAVECHIKNLLNRDGVCSGIGHTLCKDIIIKSCKIDTITTKFIDNINTSGHTAIGILPFLSSAIKIEDCDISNITGCCDDAHGLSLFVCSNCLVKNCKVKNVLDGAGPAKTGAKATGIEVYASEVLVTDCSVKNIKAINPQDLQAAGYSVAVATGVKFIRCKAEKVKVVDAHGKHKKSLGYGVGFGWAPDPRPEFLLPASNILYLNCTAADCQVGFDTWDHIDSVWAYIVSKCNTIPILKQPGGKRTLTCNPCSECGCTGLGCFPTPFSVTTKNQAKNNTFVHVKKIKCG